MALICNGQNFCRDAAAKFDHQSIFLGVSCGLGGFDRSREGDCGSNKKVCLETGRRNVKFVLSVVVGLTELE